MKQYFPTNNRAYNQGQTLTNEDVTMHTGMSPGNSYFKKEKISELVNYCSNNFKETKIFIPSTPAIQLN